jgi:hypothetical protein
MNEIICCPEQLVQSIPDMLEKALDFDTGNYHSPSSQVILYVLRLAVRIEEYGRLQRTRADADEADDTRRLSGGGPGQASEGGRIVLVWLRGRG